MVLRSVIESLREARRAGEQLNSEILLYFIDMAISEAEDQAGLVTSPTERAPLPLLA